MADETPFDSEDDKFRDECGVFGIYGHADAAALTALGLHALQHRGQEAAGIVTFDGEQFHIERHIGLVGDTFTKKSVMDRLGGTRAVGMCAMRQPAAAVSAMCSLCLLNSLMAALQLPIMATSQMP